MAIDDACLFSNEARHFATHAPNVLRKYQENRSKLNQELAQAAQRKDHATVSHLIKQGAHFDGNGTHFFDVKTIRPRPASERSL